MQHDLHLSLALYRCTIANPRSETVQRASDDGTECLTNREAMTDFHFPWGFRSTIMSNKWFPVKLRKGYDRQH